MDYTSCIFYIYNKREIWIIAGHIDSQSDCAYGHTRAQP